MVGEATTDKEGVAFARVFARGDRAIYTGTNDVVELTGNPVAESGEGTISNADVLVWDRRQGKFAGKGRNTIIQGVVPSNRTNQAVLPVQPKERVP